MNSEARQPGWWVVLAIELRRLWLGWPGPLLLFAVSLFLSCYMFLLAADPEMNVLSQRVMIDQTIQLIIILGMVLVLFLCADTFSGERDRSTLECLLLTSIPRGQLAAGKLLAILSLWFGMLAIAIPYILLVSSGSDIVMASVMLLVVPGTLMVGLSAGVGVLVSGLAPTNLISYAITAGIMLLLALPTQLPGSVQELPYVYWFIVLDPITAVANYQGAVIEGTAWTKRWWLLLSPLITSGLVLGLGIRFLDSRLSLRGGLDG